jgi:PAS domain S-box-containing protein
MRAASVTRRELVSPTNTLQEKARKAVHGLGFMLVAMTVAAAAWMILRDRESTYRAAELHLDNFAVVIAEHTRLALRRRDAAPLEVPGAASADPALDPGLHQRFDAQLGDLYQSLELGYTGRVLLFRDDGTLLVALPRVEGGAGRNYGQHPLFAHARAGGASGAMTSTGIIEAEEDRLLAFRKVRDHPLLVVISSPVAEILAPWRQDALVVSLGAFLFAALITAGTLLLRHQLRVTASLSREVAENETRLNSIIQSAMDALISVDEQQKIILFNAAAERIFGCTAAEALGTSLDRFIPERHRLAHREHLRRFGEAGSTMRRMGGTFVLSGLRANGEEFPIDASISHTTVAGRKFYTVILRDVTERQRALVREREAQMQLEESERRLQSIIGSAMDAIITIDAEQKIVLFNVAAEKTFGCPAAEAIGAPLERFIPARYRALHRAHVKRFGEAGVTMRRMGGDLVLEGVRATGEEFPIDASISHVTVGGRKFYTVILRDITARQQAAEALKRSNQELREIYEQMHQVREAERTRIARELHDELAQWLTALKMDASWIASRLPAEHAPLVAKAQRMKGVVDNTVAAVRRIAADLRPVMLDDLGLVPAVENLLYDLSERTGIVVGLQGDKDEIDLKDPLATAVYRMVQEALTNVARHSGASSVEVEVRKTDSLHVRVRDNGQGLRPDPNHKSYGLLGIRERARTLGGNAQIYSPPEGGTIVDIEIPLQVHAESGAAT